MNDQPSTTDPKKVFDISPPDQTVPSATSRPIIVSNKPEQTDRMVQLPTPAPEAPATTSAAEPATPEPVSTAAESNVTYEAPTAPPSAGTVIEPQMTGATNEVVTPSIYADTEGGQQISSSDISNAVVAEPSKVEPTSNNQQQVVVHKNSHSIGKSLFWIALIIIALVIVFDALLDYGVLNLSLPHTHFLQ